MANVGKTEEKAIRAAIVAQIEIYSDLCGIVFDRRRFVKSRKDFVYKLGRKNVDNQTKIKFVQVEFVGFKDDFEQGSDDQPAIILQYRIHIFMEFEDIRSDDSNSDEDFTGLILSLRNEFLYNRSFAGGLGSPLVNDEFALFGADTLTDATGHYVNLSLEVTKTANC